MATSTRVLFIGGEGRSGSTVLERLIAAQPGTCAVGELKNLFERGVAAGELCGCGRSVRDCELWSEVGRRLVGGWDTPAGRELVSFFTRVNHRMQLPVILAGRGALVARARSVLADLYPIIAELSGSSVIVDSSKHPSWAYLLAGTEGIDLRVVHLVRHPSAVVHSWSSPVRRPHSGTGPGDPVMAAHAPVEVCIRWDVFNHLFRHLARRGVPTTVIRYEDYVEDIDGTLQTCMALSGLTFRPPSGMASGHGIAGNPSRFAAEGAQIVRDDRWLTQMSASRHLLVSGLTWPTRRIYGYRHDRSAPVGPYPRRARATALPRSRA
ncbi:MAG: sulfotransferase [Acidimicrobiales bacterium]